MDASKIKFISSDSRTQSNKDITIVLLKNDIVGITLRGRAIGDILNIKKDGTLAPCVMIAFAGERMYIKGTYNSYGFKVNHNPQSKNKYIRIPSKYIDEQAQEWIVNNEGDYELQYDAESKFYYVEPKIKFISREGM